MQRYPTRAGLQTKKAKNTCAMKPQHLLLVFPAAMAYSVSGKSIAFVAGPASPQHGKAGFLSDIETTLESLEWQRQHHPLQTTESGTAALEQAEALHGMPWKSSIDKTAEDSDLLYMPFWEWQMKFMKENLSNIKVSSCHNGETDFTYNVNTEKKARIVNVCASSDEYRKIRMTYYDAGDNTQVFNAVWYPDPKYNLPVLGIDLLAFNRKKFLAIVDFQPLYEDEGLHAATYEEILKPIKEKYDSLKGRMSSKFYDETQFFSQQMLFARFDDEGVVGKELFPAFTEYVTAHLDLMRSVGPEPKDTEAVLERQKEYDTYSAERDPATGLFTAMYGKDWAESFVHDFLFSLSKREATQVFD